MCLEAGLPECLAGFVNGFSDGGPVKFPFPGLFLTPNQFKPDNSTDMLLSFKGLQDLSFATTGKKVLFNATSVCTLMFSEGDLTKRSGDLQWGALHCAMATKVLVAKLRSDISTLCMLCHVSDTLFHC